MTIWPPRLHAEDCAQAHFWLLLKTAYFWGAGDVATRSVFSALCVSVSVFLQWLLAVPLPRYVNEARFFMAKTAKTAQANPGATISIPDGSGNILQTDSLLAPHDWDADFRNALCAALDLGKDSIRSWHDLAHFDVIVTNPPFGSKIPVKGAVLEQFALARIWHQDKKTGHWLPTEKLQSSVPPEILFIERCTQFLKEGGRMGIVLPDSILGSPGLGYVREWILNNHRVVASLDLHADTFQPHNGTQTSVLILRKKTKDERIKEGGTMPPYNVFMAMVERVGHDKRGNTLFLRDRDGNEILEDSGDGRRAKVIDDQTRDVPAIFTKWMKEEGLSW